MGQAIMRFFLIPLVAMLVLGCNRAPDANDPRAQTMNANVSNWPGPNEFDRGGCRSWFYCIPYQADIQKALDQLRDQEFKARRFYRNDLPSKTIEEAMRNADAPGTRSILDIKKVSSARKPFTISPASVESLQRVFGTDKPSRSVVEKVVKAQNSPFPEFLETYDRGEGVYIMMYDGDRPVEVFIAGWSCD